MIALERVFVLRDSRRFAGTNGSRFKLSLVARAERHFIAGADGTRRMEILRNGAALCAPALRAINFADAKLSNRPFCLSAVRTARFPAWELGVSKDFFV